MRSSASHRQQRHRRIRSQVSGTAARPRLAVFRSLKHITAQLIDDQTGTTLAVASDQAITSGTKSERAAKVGQEIATKAKAAKISTVVFDRGGYLFHGRVKALAEGARAEGLKF